jgi:type VI secretion system protein ImpB
VAKGSGQKFIARNRAPRVQIEYDVEVYGAEKKVQLPFVMGVMADLSGKPAEALPAVADRKFLEVDIDNFDDRLKSMKPRVAFAVPNTLTSEGNLSVDITFESMDDFSPAAIARKVEPLRKLLETRTQLANLLTYMDGKSGAEDLIGRLLQDPTLLRAMASTPNPDAEKPAAKAAPTPPPVAASAAPVAAVAATAAPEASSDDNLDDLLGDVGGEEPASGGDGGDSGGGDDLDALLNDL